MPVLIDLPTGSDGRETVSINVEEIAAARGHVVTSYSYVDYTLITLKNGVEYDCRVSHADFLKRLRQVIDEACP